MGFADRIDVAMDWTDDIPTVILNGTTMRFESVGDAKFVFGLLNDLKSHYITNDKRLEDIYKELSDLLSRVNQ